MSPGNQDTGIYGPPYMYDPSKFGISFLTRWQGTILPLVCVSPLFWFLMITHVCGNKDKSPQASPPSVRSGGQEYVRLNDSEA